MQTPNREWWDEVTPIHVRSHFYDVDGFLKGRETLDSIEIEGVGDVRGKSLVHLQCHFGLDTLFLGAPRGQCHWRRLLRGSHCRGPRSCG